MLRTVESATKRKPSIAPERDTTPKKGTATFPGLREAKRSLNAQTATSHVPNNTPSHSQGCSDVEDNCLVAFVAVCTRPVSGLWGVRHPSASGGQVSPAPGRVICCTSHAEVRSTYANFNERIDSVRFALRSMRWLCKRPHDSDERKHNARDHNAHRETTSRHAHERLMLAAL